MEDTIRNASFRDLKAAMRQAGIKGDMDRKCKVAGNPIGGDTMQENALRIINAESKLDQVVRNLLGVAPATKPVPAPATVIEAVAEVVQPEPRTVSNVVPLPVPAASPAVLSGPQPKVVATKTLGKLFGIRGKGSEIEMEVWNDSLAPQLDPLYQWSKRHLVSIALTVKRGGNVWLAGPPGTGKTEFVKNFCAVLGRSYWRVGFDSGAEKYEFIGGERVKAGSTFWQDGIILRGMRRPGAVILLDEISFARPEFISILHGALEPLGTVSIAETGEVVRKAPGVSFMAADNSNGRGDSYGISEGIRPQSPAMVSRFSRTVEFEYLDHDTEVSILTSRTSCTPQLASLVVGFVEVCRRQAAGAAIELAPGMRDMINLCSALSDDDDSRLAFTEVVVNKQPQDCQEAMQQIWVSNVSKEQIKAALAGEVYVPSEEQVQQPAESHSF